MLARLRKPALVVAFTGFLAVQARPAHAEWPTFDAVTHFLLQQMQNALNSAINRVYDNITNIGNLLGDRLSQGFTQISNYQRAQIGAIQQVTDAALMANARVQRDVRNAGIRDQHVPSPQACYAIDGGQAAEVSRIQAGQVAASINFVMDQRGEGAPGTPAYYGQAQAMSAANALHLSRYCNPTEAAAGLCTASARPNADVRFSSFYGADVYADNEGVNAANDYTTNLLQPVVPAALRGDQLASVSGQDAAAMRRGYDARMSLARGVLAHQIALQSPSVVLTDEQKRLLQARGVTPGNTGSWLQVMGLEVDRRVSDVGWASALQTMPPATVQREIAIELAFGNYIAMQTLRLQMQNAALNAAQLAAVAEQGFQRATAMPAPTVASN
jgi:hypothetical protein